MYTTTDLDKLKQIMAESAEHADIIGKLIESHNESISTITHEIRNPLTLIYSSLQLIESAHPEVKTFRHWDALHQDILYVMQLLTDLSDYNNGLSLHKTPVDTSIFLKQLVLSFAASSEASDIEFVSHIVPELPTIQADTRKLKEALLNLLKNAFEAFPAGTAGCVRMEADTICSADSCFLRIRIQDNGCGISSEHLEDIFTPFVTFKSNGTGLGLPLSKRIIEAHGGTLQVCSNLNTGTTFTILLPAPSAQVSSGSCDIE